MSSPPYFMTSTNLSLVMRKHRSSLRNDGMPGEEGQTIDVLLYSDCVGVLFRAKDRWYVRASIPNMIEWKYCIPTKVPSSIFNANSEMRSPIQLTCLP